MLVSEILLAARNDYLDDMVVPYKWSDDELLRHLNKALNEWCRETGCIRDITTEAICKTLLLANKYTYPIDSRITEIHTPCNIINCNSATDTTTHKGVDVKTDAWADDNLSAWRISTGDTFYLIPDYGTSNFRIVSYGASTSGYWTASVAVPITFAAGTKTITHTGGLFSSLLIAGDQVVISATTSNGTTAVPVTFTVVTVTSDSFTVSETVVGETSTAGIIQKVMNTLWLTVSRLPLAQLTIGGVLTETPEINFAYHSYLIDGILRDAYQKQDSQCFDKQKAMECRQMFDLNKRKAKSTRDWLRDSSETAKPRLGTL